MSFDNKDNPNRDLIVDAKELRAEGDALLQKLKSLRNELSVRKLQDAARHASISITHAEDVIMRLGMVLKYTGTPNPYPESYNPENAIVEPTADGLKL